MSTTDHNRKLQVAG